MTTHTSNSTPMPLTGKQQQALDTIQAFKEAMGYMPTARELGEALHLASPCFAQHHLKVLQRKGYIRRVPGKARCLAVVAQQDTEAVNRPLPSS